MAETEISFAEFQKHIGLTFESSMLLQCAMTHRSYVNEHEDIQRDNERLEFLGDAVLDFVVASFLFKKYSDMPEGELSQLRSALVRTDSLALLAKECRIGEFLLVGKGEENNGGRTRVSNLCQGFEALVGAVYLDQGVEAVKSFVVPLFENLLAYILERSLHLDARSQLQEKSQNELRVTPTYRLVDSAGPEHEKEFLVEVVIDGVVIGSGIGRNKRAAAQAAARAALQRLENATDGLLTEVSAKADSPAESSDPQMPGDDPKPSS